MIYSPQQQAAIDAVTEWLCMRDKQVFYLAGFAGSGKTTLAIHLSEIIRGEVCFAAFTGKAALVMQTKGCHGASTIHSMIYKIVDANSPTPEFKLDKDAKCSKAALIIIDECSMVGEDLGKDLLSFGVPVLVLGDPAQLPPVRGEGFFTANEPDFMLTEIHRQALESPIIRMSMDVREGRELQYGDYGDVRVITREQLNAADVLAADQVIVGLNKSRRNYNKRIRELKNREGHFRVGDRVVCLKNNVQKGLLNGGLWTVKKIRRQTESTTRMIVAPLDAGMCVDAVEVTTHHCFYQGTEAAIDWQVKKKYDQFDFGYALTCHKMQGSQFDNILVFDESHSFRENQKEWLYTAITRAAKKLTIVM